MTPLGGVTYTDLARARGRDVRRLARWLGLAWTGGRLDVAHSVHREIRVLALEEIARCPGAPSVACRG
jgi:hypothetical protein